MASPDQTRTVVITVAVVVALLAAVGALALVLGLVGGDEQLSSSPTTVAPATSSPSPSPSASPSPAETAAPTEDATWPVDLAFVTPEAAAAAEEPGWAVTDAEGEPGPLLDTCGEGTFPLGDDIAASDERTMASEREAGGSELVQEVFRYGSMEAAEEAFAGYAAAVVRCPTQPDPEELDFSSEYEVVLQDEVRGAQRLLVKRLSCTQGGCAPQFASYVLVAQAADGLTVASYGIGEDGDPREPADALLGVVTEQLVTAVNG